MKICKIQWKAWLLPVVVAMMAGCSGDDAKETPGLPTEEEWAVSLSRSTTGNNNVRVQLEYGENNVSSGTLVPSNNDEDNASWKNNTIPEWPKDEEVEVKVIAFCPDMDLPATVSASAGTAYMMDYHTCTPDNKPKFFTLTHLMAQLEVHIKLHDEAQHHYEPKEAVIQLGTSATVNYPGKKLVDVSTPTDWSLGTFTQESESTATDENWVNTAQTVIPQTLAAGVPCLRFKAGETVYTFTPETDIVLTAGKKTKLYLGVAYGNTYVTVEGITVAGWTETEIDAGEAEE